MISFIKKHLPEIILTCLVLLYSIYFSLLTTNRSEKLYSHYFDLGIMNQTVYNTYKGIQTGDFSRILQMTDPHATANQVKRMSVHNDMILALLAPFYFLHEGPETLLVIQTITLALGGVFIFLIAKKVLHELPYAKWLALVFSFCYLLYPPMEKTNKFDFHGVALATTFLLAMFYYWKEKKYKTSIVFAFLSLLTKEQVGMVISVFGAYILYEQFVQHHLQSFLSKKLATIIHFVKKIFKKDDETKEKQFAGILIGISIFWILFSLLVIIPASRGEEHFAAHYYDHIKSNPLNIFIYPFRYSTFEYFVTLLGPLGFLSLLSPIQFLITIPELGINLLSSNANMRNTYFHYDSLITPFVFISAIYGALWFYKGITTRNKHISKSIIVGIMSLYLIIFSLFFSYKDSSLPYAKEPDIYPWKEPKQRYYEVMAWKKILDDDKIKVSTTGTLAPHFTSRQYFYDFSWKYIKADYLILDKHEVFYGYLNEKSAPAYKDLQKDKNYIKIYDENGIEVYRKVIL